MIETTDDFTKWASGYSGCNGDVTGAIWFCGIEYGGDETEIKFDFANVSIPSDVAGDFFKYHYNIKVAKLYSALRGVANYKSVTSQLFRHDSGTFKMNLYPISFHHDADGHWPEWMYPRTGFPTKKEYRNWCRQYRFPEILKWVKTYSPKVIICTGIGYQNDFIMAFNGNAVVSPQEKVISDHRLVLLNINEDKTVLVIIPFLGGPHGLNSDQLLNDFAKEIENLCATKIGNNCTGLFT